MNGKNSYSYLYFIFFICLFLFVSQGSYAQNRLQNIKFNYGLDYTSGSYGEDDQTEIIYSPFSISAEYGLWSISATVPWLKVNGPALILDGADFACEIHADNQYSPNDVVKAKEKLKQDYDLIIGSRFVNKNPFLKDGMPFLRFITNKFMSFITRLLLGIKLTEFHTGYKIYGKNLCKKVPYQNNSDNYLFSFEIILQSAFFNLKYDEINIASSYKGFHQSCSYTNGLIYLLGNFKTILFFFLAKLNIYKYKIFK